MKRTTGNSKKTGEMSVSNKIENKLIGLGRTILGNYGYIPQLNVRNRGSYKGRLFSNGTNYGIDDVFFSDNLPKDDPLNFKLKSHNNIFFAVDYKSNNFPNNENKNEDYVNVKLMRLDKSYVYTKGKLKKELRRGHLEDYYKSPLGIFTKVKETDYQFYIRNRWKDEILNAFLVDFKDLRDHVIDNLNNIRLNNGRYPLKVDESTVNLLFGIYETYELYQENNEGYDFKLFPYPDRDAYNDKEDLIMSIKVKRPMRYIKFNENGKMVKNNSL